MPDVAYPAPLTVSDVLNAHAQRDFGSSGFREVTLTIFTRDEPAFSYQLLHVWRLEEGPTCSSLFFLTEPAVLSGTAVKMVEHPYTEDSEIWLRLRTARHPLQVDPSRHDQTVLGTDFTYSDLRFWLPTNTLDITGLEFQLFPEFRGCLLKARQHTGVGSFDVRIMLDSDRWLPMSIEWLDSGGSPQRIYSAGDLVRVDDVWTPRIITVTRPHDRYRSVMTLRRAIHKVPVGPELFLTENLTQLSKCLFEGWIGRSNDSW